MGSTLFLRSAGGTGIGLKVPAVEWIASEDCEVEVAAAQLELGLVLRIVLF